jgi:hypothetical protein
MVACACVCLPLQLQLSEKGRAAAVCFAPRLLRIRMSLQHIAAARPFSDNMGLAVLHSIGPCTSCVFELAAPLRVQR